MLLFERDHTHWLFEGRREQAILDRFGMSREVYGLRLVRLVRRPEAEAFDAQTVRRLRRRLDARSQATLPHGSPSE